MSSQGFAPAELNGNRRRKKAREQAALAATFARAEAFTRQLQAELAEAGRLHKIVQGIIGELRI